MNQQDKQSAENICKVIKLLPDTKREYLMGVADGMAAMAGGGSAPPRLACDSGAEQAQT